MKAKMQVRSAGTRAIEEAQRTGVIYVRTFTGIERGTDATVARAIVMEQQKSVGTWIYVQVK